MTTSKNLDSLTAKAEQETSRRTVLKAAAYVAPAVVTMAVTPAFAVNGSRSAVSTGRGRDSRGGSNTAPVRNRGGRGRGRGSSGS